MTTSITDLLANDIRAIDGDHEMGAGALAEELVKLGWIKITKPQKNGPDPLSAYKDGDRVEVIKDGVWTRGTINGIEKRLGLVYVFTDRGPVSVASNKFIRKPQAPEIESP